MPSKASKSRVSEYGMTLLECIAAIAIISTSLLAGLSMYSIKTEIQATEHVRWQAQRFLTREMERMQAVEFEHLSALPLMPVPEDSSFMLRRDVNVVDGVTKHIAVTVEWTSPNGTACSETLDTVRCQGVK